MEIQAMSGTRAHLFAVITVFLLVGAPGALAGGAADFTFKRITVKKNPVGARIDVQITPEEDYYKNHQPSAQSQTLKAESGTGEESVAPDLSTWFWDHVPATLESASSGRLQTAMEQLQRDPARMAALSPDLSGFQALVETFGTDILLATLGKEVSPALVLAVLGVESSGRADALSPAGAVGLMQLIPETAKRFGVTDSTDPKQSITGGAAYLDWLLKEFNRDPLLALAGYNAGANAVRKNGGVPPFAETRAYVPKVIAAWQVARVLCMTPPKYATDGCVFKSQGKTQGKK